jgi:hypothetical protein
VVIVLSTYTLFINKSPDAEQISRGETGREERAIEGGGRYDR